MDLGFSDDTAILWFQVGKELRIIDAYSNHGQSIDHYDTVLKRKGYKYGTWIWLPHDARAMSLQTGRSIEQQFSGSGWKPRIVPQLGLIDGIQASRLTLRDCYIDASCSDFINAAKQYQREYDEDKKCFRDKPRHDWTSHYADAFRYACLVWREEMQPKEPPPPRFKPDLTIDEIIARQARKYAHDD
jgi:phage terminase large subunit